MDRPNQSDDADRHGSVYLGISIAAGLLGLTLLAVESFTSSATYDENAYLGIAARWWQGHEDNTLTRMGSPVTFYKLQAAPAFAILSLIGRRELIANALERQATLLPLVRIGSLWIWLLAFSLTVGWARWIYGRRAMACAAVLFALSPNILAHGNLITMELPLIAATTAMCLLFWRFLETGSRSAFVAGAIIGGLGFSCKFTTVVIPPILGTLWLLDLTLKRREKPGRAVCKVVGGMLAYLIIFLFSNLIVTGFAMIPASERVGDHPAVPGLLSKLVERKWPVDWVGSATQMRHQRNGGPSYLLGVRKMTGWWYYYPVALAVKLPLSCLLLLAGAFVRTLKFPAIRRDWIFPAAIGVFMFLAMMGSKRNYGVRYLLPLAPLAIVWISGLAERTRSWRIFVCVGLVGQAIAVFSVFPHELSFFNRAAGGTLGGRRILADSNLDWGQGLQSFRSLETRYPSITLFYFGEADPRAYGVRSEAYVITANETLRPLPADLRVDTAYVAVSASLQYGPWGPPGYFKRLDGLKPVAFTDDGTIAVYHLPQ